MLLMIAGTARIAQHARCAVGAAAALSGNTQIKLQALQTVRAIGHSLTDLLVRDSSTYTNDHVRPLVLRSASNRGAMR